MPDRSPKSMALYHLMQRRGYPEEFCVVVTRYLNTDFTAARMIGYLNHVPKAPMEEVAEELLAILEDRAAIMAKKRMESTQAAWNRIMEEGFGEDEE